MWGNVLVVFVELMVFFSYGACTGKLGTNSLASVIDESDYVRPNSVKDYLDARDSCNFEPYAADTNVGCPGVKMESCEVETNFLEGKGYVHIVRMGPFTTTGGGQEWKCDIKGSASLRDELAYVTRSLVALTEPNTGMLVSFPPLHFHHASLSGNVDRIYTPPIDEDIMQQLPWVRDNFFTSSSTDECLRELGGPACYSFQMAPGTALKQYAQIGQEVRHFQVEDVRAMNSPPLSSMIEFASFHITEPDPNQPPLKPSVSIKFEMGERAQPHTYALKYNTYMYIAATFYLPIKVHFSQLSLHMHSVEGDEVWVIRGTQDDMGIHKSKQSPVYWKNAVRGSTDGYALASAQELSHGETPESLKTKIEESMRMAGEEWARRHQGKVYADNAGTGAGPQATGSTKGENAYFKPYDEASPPPGAGMPEIFCKWYGAVDYITQDNLEEQQQEFQKLFQHGGRQHFRGTSTSASRRLSSSACPSALNATCSTAQAEAHRKLEGRPNTDEIGPDGYVIQETNTEMWSTEMVPPEQQFENFYAGALPGNYYRHPTNALMRKESKFTQCNSFTIEAGDYLSFLAFNAPRTNPTLDDNEFFLQPVKMQHSTMFGIAYMPDVPWFY